MPSTSELVAMTNEQVSIVMVCQMLGMDVSTDVGEFRRKVHCPFGGIYHSDQGASAAMRIYPESNSAYCFSCSYYYTPVKLAARALGVDTRTAAMRLLDRAGYRAPDLRALWRQSEAEPEPNRVMLGEALKSFCRRASPDWATRQFDQAVASTLTRCLTLLDLVRTGEDVSLWLSRCKASMGRVLNRNATSPSQDHTVGLEILDDRQEGKK